MIYLWRSSIHSNLAYRPPSAALMYPGMHGYPSIWCSLNLLDVIVEPPTTRRDHQTKCTQKKTTNRICISPNSRASLCLASRSSCGGRVFRCDAKMIRLGPKYIYWDVSLHSPEEPGLCVSASRIASRIWRRAN